MKFRIATILFFLSGILTVSNARIAKYDDIFDHYSTENGLPHNSICDIHQDSKGYIWICTWYGLSRFDGIRFVNYNIKQGDALLPVHNRLLSIREDVNGYLWLTTYDYRLVRFDPVEEIFTSIPDALASFSDYDAKITTFHNAANGDLWVGLHGTGLFRVRPDLSYSRIRHIGKEIDKIFEASNGDIYAVSERGLFCVRDDDSQLVWDEGEISSFCEYGTKLYFSEDDGLIVLSEDGEASKIGFDKDDLGRLTTISLTGKDEGKVMYAGFSKGAIAQVDTVEMSLNVRHYDMGRVRYLFPDSEGLLWIATDRTGIYSYNPKNSRFRRYQQTRNVTSYYTDTLAMVKEKGNMVWIKMNDYGFGWYDRTNDVIVPINNVKEEEDVRFMNGVSCFEIDNTGVLWMSTAKRGLERVTPITPNVDVIAPPSKFNDPAASEIRAIFKDSSGNVWVAAKSAEVYCYNSDMTSCERLPERFGLVYSIFEDNAGNLWFGTKGEGLVKMTFNSKGGYTLTRFRHDPQDENSISSDQIYSIEQDVEGKLWFGTFGGGLSMLEDPDQEEFINVYNNFPNYPLDYAERVRYVHSLPSGMMLVATIGGLLWFDPTAPPRTAKFTFLRDFPHASIIGNNDVIHIFSDEKGHVFLSTFGGGLYRMSFDHNGNPLMSAINMASGLASNMVFSAVEDKNGDIWLATERGVSKVDANTWKVTNFSRYDGIIQTTFSEATCALLDDGSVLFGSLDNIYKINPSSIRQSFESARLVISGISVNSKRVPMAEKVVIPHDYSFFRVEYTSLNYRLGGSMNYSYMLKGYDKDWITNPTRYDVTYSRIPHGHYEFIVSVSPEEGSGAEEFTSVLIYIRPSIWNSTVAKILYVLLAALLLFIIWRIVNTSSKLRANIKVEKDLNDAKIRFLTNISHELRTPLTLILGGIDDIDKNLPEGDKNEYSVSLVHRNANRMMMLVNQLLDIRTVVNGKILLKVAQIDIVDLLKQVYDDFKDLASERSIEMRLTHSVDKLMVWGDKMRLEALIYNLFSNAYKYTADGGCIEGAIFYREGDSEFTIMVKDNGVGIEKDQQTAIFEPFVRAADAVFSGMGSSGIGLSFSKEIAEMHGGKIWVESEKDKGSQFFVRLPIDRNHFSEEVAEFIEADPLSEGPSGVNKYRVEATYPEGAVKLLVVEDNPELRVYMFNNLASRFEVKDVGNGKEALQVIGSEWMPDVILTDLMMPEMDGIELINYIRNDFDISHIPIIMFTAKHETDTQIQAMKYGADAYISKPFTMELLVAQVENLLKRRQQFVKLMASSENGMRGGRIKLTPEEVVITDRDEDLIKKVSEWLEENISDSEITVDQLAVYVGMGRTSMYNKIKGLTGKSPVELIQDFRMEKATYYLKLGQLSVAEISYKVGFSDPGYFSRSFKKHFGVSPSEYIKENKN